MRILHLPVMASIVLVFLLLSEEVLVREMTPDRPNVLWITCEDISPYLGNYGFDQANTPNLDKLAKNQSYVARPMPIPENPGLIRRISNCPLTTPIYLKSGKIGRGFTT